MPSDTGRALSIQQQYALELISEQAGLMAGALVLAASQSTTRAEADSMAAQYEVLLLGAMMAVASTRVGYLQAYAAAEGITQFDIPTQVLRPTVQDVLVGGAGAPLPPVQGVGSTIDLMPQTALRAPSSQGAMWAALTNLQRDLEAGRADALSVAQSMLAESTESAAMSTADYVDAMVLGPDRRTVALRRVAHPGACQRCVRVAGALVFKSSPRLRHPQCRCSFEPVLLGDPEYAVRLGRYQRNANYTQPGPYGRDRRSRGRAQLERAQFRQESVFLQDSWTDFLRDEQTRLASLVTAVPSNTYRQWAVMTSANQAEIGSDLLPVITRN